jgi:NADH-quinone oxidoreductase subunit L
MSTVVGLLQFPGLYLFEHFIQNSIFEETVVATWGAPKFDIAVALPSTIIAVAGIVVGVVYYKVFNHDAGIVRRFAPARLVHSVLKNKYYLDHLWTDLIIGSIKGPIAKAAYWFNQNGLDGVVNTAGSTAVGAARFVYKFIDQGVVDGTANGLGSSANGLGDALRRGQTGKVQNYAVVFIGAVGLAALALVLFV